VFARQENREGTFQLQKVVSQGTTYLELPAGDLTDGGRAEGPIGMEGEDLSVEEKAECEVYIEGGSGGGGAPLQGDPSGEKAGRPNFCVLKGLLRARPNNKNRF